MSILSDDIDKKEVKILLINGQSINTDNATGVTLSALFCNFPKENLLEISFLEPNIKRIDLVSFQMPIWSNPVKWLLRKFFFFDRIAFTVNESIKKDTLLNEGSSINLKKRVIYKS